MSTVRVKSGIRASVRPQSTQTFMVLASGQEFDADDPIVKEFAWAFDDGNDVEDASAAPGTKRNTRR